MPWARRWSPFQEKYIDALRKVVDKITDEDIRQSASRRREKIEAHKKALTNPET